MKKLYLTTLLGAAITLPYMAQAATDGTLGATSTGSVGVQLKVLADPVSNISISGLSDIIYPDRTLDILGGSASSTDLCVYADQASTFSIEITSANNPVSDGLGTLKASNGQTLVYLWVLYYNQFDSGLGFNIANGIPTDDLVGCGGNTADRYLQTHIQHNANFNVTEDTVFTDTLTITVSPE